MFKAIPFALLSILLCVAGTSVAQESNLVQVVTVKVRPGTEPKFEQFVRAFRDASQRQNLENYWLTSESVSGEPTYTFNLAQPGGWGSMGGEGPDFVAAFGEAEAARIGQLAEDSIESVHTAFYRAQADMSNPYPGGRMGPPAAVIYSHISLNAGMGQQFAEVSRKSREASVALYPRSYYTTQTPGFGANAVRVVSIVQTWADLDSPPPGPQQRNIQHFGPAEGGRINSLAEMSISSIESVLNRTRPDLNYQPDS